MYTSSILRPDAAPPRSAPAPGRPRRAADCSGHKTRCASGMLKDALHHRIRAEPDERPRLAAIADAETIQQTAERQMLLQESAGAVRRRRRSRSISIAPYSTGRPVASTCSTTSRRYAVGRVFAVQHLEHDLAAVKLLQPRSHVAVMHEQTRDTAAASSAPSITSQRRQRMTAILRRNSVSG